MAEGIVPPEHIPGHPFRWDDGFRCDFPGCGFFTPWAVNRVVEMVERHVAEHGVTLDYLIEWSHLYLMSGFTAEGDP